MVKIEVMICAWVGMVETVGFHQEMWFIMLESVKD
jgi:hypothetical protein